MVLSSYRINTCYSVKQRHFSAASGTDFSTPLITDSLQSASMSLHLHVITGTVSTVYNTGLTSLSRMLEVSDLPESSRLFCTCNASCRGMLWKGEWDPVGTGQWLGTAEKSCWRSIGILKMSFCLLACPRADARDSEGFLENDLARKLCECCHGDQLGGSGQGKGTTFPTL